MCAVLANENIVICQRWDKIYYLLFDINQFISVSCGLLFHASLGRTGIRYSRPPLTKIDHLRSINKQHIQSISSCTVRRG